MSTEYNRINNTQLITKNIIFNNKDSEDTDFVYWKQQKGLQLSSHEFKLYGGLNLQGGWQGTVHMSELCSMTTSSGLEIDKLKSSYTVVGDFIDVAGWITVGSGATIGFIVDTSSLTVNRWYKVTIKGSPTYLVHQGGQPESKNSRTWTAVFCYDNDFGAGKKPCWTISGAYESDEYGHIIWMEPRTSGGYDSNLKITDAPYLGFYVMRAPTWHAIHTGPASAQNKTFSVTACCIDKNSQNVKLEALPLQFNIDGVNNLLT